MFWDISHDLVYPLKRAVSFAEKKWQLQDKAHPLLLVLLVEQNYHNVYPLHARIQYI